MRQYKIALIPGDGIGKEVVPPCVSIIRRAGMLFGFSCSWDEKPWGCEYYIETGRMMPENGLASIRHHDAILLGAVGFPGVPDHVSLWGLLLPIRRTFDQYVNLRPVRMMPGVTSPLREELARDIDYVIVRENTEGEYSDRGSVVDHGLPSEEVIQHAHFSRQGVDRVLRYAFDLARSREKNLVSATKSNGIFVSMPYWDERCLLMAANYEDVELVSYHIDILAAHLVQRPASMDVIVASNLMGDILSDLGAGTTGTIGLAPSANLNPERNFPSMFEPVHGSAPDIYGQNIANPIAQIWSGAMMLTHLGEYAAATAIMRAIEAVLIDGPKTRDLGGAASTIEVAQEIERLLTT